MTILGEVLVVYGSLKRYLKKRGEGRGERRGRGEREPYNLKANSDSILAPVVTKSS